MHHDPITFGDFLLSCSEGISLVILFLAFIGAYVFFAAEALIKSNKQNKKN